MAEALVGGAVLSATLQVLLDRLASREFINFFRGRKHDGRLLKKMKLKLIGLNKVLNDAENKQITDQAVKDWLDELKDALYHADDLVDEIATEALRCKVETEYQNSPNQVRAIISTSNDSFDSEIESKLEEMIDVLEDFKKEKYELGLREVVEQNWSHRLPPTASLLDESSVYGRENDKEEVMKLLLSDGDRSSSSAFDVVPIVGMGGVGKTTLAKLLFNDGRVDEHFCMKSWVCVSNVFDVLKVTRTIVEAVTGRASDANDLNSLQVKLKDSLSGKKFLMVLDDVWNENYDHWDVLMDPFRFGAYGSKIIITTRNESVASVLQTVPFYGLQVLPEEDCWKLFCKHAFVKGDCNAHPNLEKIGKEIVKKCKGLPLAAKTLGGLLRSQRDAKDWNDMLESAIWELSDEKSNILPALRLSYYYLPSHLKRCFAHCSIFKKDYEFDVKELVSTWIAEGFLEKPKSNKTMEERGFECFHELLSRSFFQRSNAKTSRFVMHDLLHDLAESVVGDFYHRLENGKPHSISEKVRHFSYVRGQFDGFEKFKVIKDAKYLRTFLQIDRRTYGQWLLSRRVLDEILSSLTHLRLLSLPRYQIGELPNSIGNLIHLRFLDLSNTLISHLPESVCTLCNLETLLLCDCHLLTTLPAEIVKLILLHVLDLSGTNLKEMPMQMSRLKDLQHLTAFVVGKCSGSGINELKELHRLRGTISIKGLENVTSGSDALEAKMREKRHIEKLSLEWGSTTGDSQNEIDVLEKLEPHTNLKHLEIKNYGGTRFPPWLGDQSFCYMVSLRIENCNNCFSLPPLGQLCALKELTISRMSGIRNVGQEFYGESGSLSKPFESLETLSFEEMSEWVDWCILDAGEFPRLQKLELIKCPKLIGDLPKEVPSLVRLEIKACPELVASLTRSTSVRKLLLRECQGIQWDWQGVSFVETLQISGFAKEFAGELLTLTNLKELKVERCPRFLSFSELVLSNEMSNCYASLERLTLDGCESLISLPLGFFPKLRYLRIEQCINFETLLIPDGIEFQNLQLLESLSILFCNNMVSFPFRGLPAPKLSSLWFQSCKKLEALPEQMHTLLPSLQQLALSDCPEIDSFPEGGLPSKLGALHIWNCMKLVGGRRDWGLQTLPSLTSFLLEGEFEDVVESFPEVGLLPSTLESLRIQNMPNLKSLNDRVFQLLGSLRNMHISNCPQIESLPEEGLPSTLISLHIQRMPNLKSLNKSRLHLLGSLKYMRIRHCHKLQSLPEEGLPNSLFELQIQGCPLLKPRCCREDGEDWHKIAHVPGISIDGEAILDRVCLGPEERKVFSGFDDMCPGKTKASHLRYSGRFLGMILAQKNMQRLTTIDQTCRKLSMPTLPKFLVNGLHAVKN